MPTYEAEVVALEGDHMIVADLRIGDLEPFRSEERRETLSRVAEMADAVMVVAMRNIVNPISRCRAGPGPGR